VLAVRREEYFAWFPIYARPDTRVDPTATMLSKQTAILAALVLISMAGTVRAQSESYYRKLFCAGMRTEMMLPSGARADCVSATHAIEVDFSTKWGEAIGQSLNYAREMKLVPGNLICKAGIAACLGLALVGCTGPI
jgi:hypothetical protein